MKEEGGPGSTLPLAPHLQKTCEQQVAFQGHRGAVMVLKFLEAGARLVSGSADTDLIVWDVVNETGLFRLRGHKGAVTDCVFIGDNILLSSSKDTFVRAWDLETQHCISTVVGHRSEIWALAVDQDARHLFTGSTDNEMRVWQIVRPVGPPPFF
jgi:U3 small nucleolar RNA-associated protein 12